MLVLRQTTRSSTHYDLKSLKLYSKWQYQTPRRVGVASSVASTVKQSQRFKYKRTQCKRVFNVVESDGKTWASKTNRNVFFWRHRRVSAVCSVQHRFFKHAEELYLNTSPYRSRAYKITYRYRYSLILLYIITSYPSSHQNVWAISKWHVWF